MDAEGFKNLKKVLIVLPVQIILITYGKNIEGRRKAAIPSCRRIPGYKETPAKYAPDSELADKIDGKKVNKYDRVQCVTPPTPLHMLSGYNPDLVLCLI